MRKQDSLYPLKIFFVTDNSHDSVDFTSLYLILK